MTKFLILVASISVLGCSELKQRREIPSCDKLYNHLINDWRYNDSEEIFESSYPKIDFDLLRDKDCLKGLSEGSIKKLLGAPSFRKERSFYYYVTQACNGEKNISSSGCSFVEVVFAKKTGKVVDVGLGSSLSTP